DVALCESQIGGIGKEQASAKGGRLIGHQAMAPAGPSCSVAGSQAKSLGAKQDTVISFLMVRWPVTSLGIPFGLLTNRYCSRPNGILQVMRVRDRLTSATATLMQRHGVAGTGIAEILSTSGVTRRSINLNFPGGKAELV